jgi:hypothetical protein
VTRGHIFSNNEKEIRVKKKIIKAGIKIKTVKKKICRIPVIIREHKSVSHIVLCTVLFDVFTGFSCDDCCASREKV